MQTFLHEEYGVPVSREAVCDEGSVAVSKAVQVRVTRVQLHHRVVGVLVEPCIRSTVQLLLHSKGLLQQLNKCFVFLGKKATRFGPESVYLEPLEEEPALAVCHEHLVTEGFVQQAELDVPTDLRPATVSVPEQSWLRKSLKNRFEMSFYWRLKSSFSTLHSSDSFHPVSLQVPLN